MYFLFILRIDDFLLNFFTTLFLKAVKSMKWAGNVFDVKYQHSEELANQLFAAAPGWLGISHMSCMAADWLKMSVPRTESL